MSCGSWLAMLSGLRLGLRATEATAIDASVGDSGVSGAAGSGGSCNAASAIGVMTPRAHFVAILCQAVLESYDQGYHRGPNPYQGAPKEIRERHLHRVQREEASHRAKRTEAEKMSQGGCQGGSPAARRGAGAAHQRGQQGLRAVDPRTFQLCFMSWDLSPPIGVVSNKWM